MHQRLPKRRTSNLVLVETLNIAYSLEEELQFLLDPKCFHLLNIRKLTKFYNYNILNNRESIDMWGLGVILYTMLMGKIPFSELNISKLSDKMNKGEYDRESDEWKSLSS